ncbi:FabD/lysophospholipase-like protein [Xylariomycetidae sp. FL2044]|nr:FabD/lysophospholipase-like protein [Xylariomycetidae sp. FL2044]
MATPGWDGTPVNLLALDGGGIRGISELRILDKIMRRVQKEENLSQLPRPCDYFHLMAGTSTGGLVAILLSRFKMTTTEAIEAYYDFSKQIFAKTERFPHMYDEKILVKIIRDMISKHEVGDYMREKERSTQCRAFVCTQLARNQGEVVRFRTYESKAKRFPEKLDKGIALSSPTKPSSEVQPDESWATRDDIQIWEACRATTAAPGYFVPMEIRRGDEVRTYVDGAMGCNNPVIELVDEATALYGTDCTLGCLVSLGTGFSGSKTIGKRKGVLAKYDLFQNVLKIVTDTENAHLSMRKSIRAEHDTYFRFNVRSGTENIRLNAYAELDALSDLTNAYVEEESAEIEKVVRILLGRVKPKGIKLGKIVHADHGQILPREKKVVHGRTAVSEIWTGRGDALRKLQQTFHPRPPEKPKERRHHLLYGQTGTGKTQTATKFLSDCGHWFDMMLWVDASNKETLECSLQDLMARSEYGYGGDGSISSFLSWLDTTEKTWILVFDNVDGDVSHLVPQGDVGDVLFIGQTMDMKPRLPVQSITRIDGMTEDEAIDLLIRSSRLENVDETTYQLAASIANDLERLPVILENAGRTVREEQLNLSAYAEHLNNHRERLLNGPGSGNTPAALRTIYPALEITYMMINSRAYESPDEPDAAAARSALQLLSLFSFFHNEGLMSDILMRASKHRSPYRPRDELGVGIQSFADLVAKDKSGKWIDSRYRSGLRVLESYSLIKRDASGKSFSMHALIHEWARNRNPNIRHRQANAARIVLFDSIELEHSTAEDYLYAFKVYPHAQAVMRHTERPGLGDLTQAATHDCKFGNLLISMNKEHEAMPVLERALLFFGEHVGPFDERTLRTIELCAIAVRNMGLVWGAQEMAMRALNLRLKNHVLMDLKTMLTDVPDLQSMNPGLMHLSTLLMGASELQSINPGLTHLSILRACTDLPSFYAFLRPEARDDLELLLRNTLRAKRHFHPGAETMTTSTQLAILVFALDRFDEALDIQREVAEESAAVNGPRHPYTQQALNNLAIILCRIGHPEEAEEILTKVLAADDNFYGPRYPERPSTMHNLASVYFAQRRYREAENLFRRAKLMTESMCGDHIPGSWRGMANVRYWFNQQGEAMSIYRLGNRKRATRLARFCYEAFKVQLAHSHWSTSARALWKAWKHEEENKQPILMEKALQPEPLFRY